DDGGGEMDDGVDAVLADQPPHQRLVAGLADDQRHALGDRPVEARRQIVEHDHALAGIGELVDHVAADIAGAARDQNCHVGQPYSQSVNTTLGGSGLQPTGAIAASARRVAAKTSSGSMSRMQRWWPSRQVGLWQGRHSRTLLVSIVAASGLSGAQCQGLVGPKIPIECVPSAAATWRRPESLETAAEADASARMASRRSC